jgi:hypothetical protein
MDPSVTVTTSSSIPTRSAVGSPPLPNPMRLSSSRSHNNSSGSGNGNDYGDMLPFKQLYAELERDELWQYLRREINTALEKSNYTLTKDLFWSPYRSNWYVCMVINNHSWFSFLSSSSDS